MNVSAQLIAQDHQEVLGNVQKERDEALARVEMLEAEIWSKIT